MKKDSRIYIAGHNGMVGAAIARNLKDKGYTNIIGRSHPELDLTDQKAVSEFFKAEKPEYVFLAAAKVGGIHANTVYPADFIMINLQIQCNIINSAYKSGVKKLIFLGSSCIYPKLCPQPIKEEYLLTGSLEPTNEAYALAKISGLKMCQFYNKQYGTDYISVMPTNLYGSHDNFGLKNSHVLPALMRKFHEAKVSNSPEVEVWGTGRALREFLHVDDMADACVYLMETYSSDDFVNVGTGRDVSIGELAAIIGKVVEYKGRTVFNTSKPDGTPRKLLDVSRLESLGWKYRIELEDGVRKTYEWFLANEGSLKK
jgi:GDP-L-fucose synthase